MCCVLKLFKLLTGVMWLIHIDHLVAGEEVLHREELAVSFNDLPHKTSSVMSGRMVGKVIGGGKTESSIGRSSVQSATFTRHYRFLACHVPREVLAKAVLGMICKGGDLWVLDDEKWH